MYSPPFTVSAQTHISIFICCCFLSFLIPFKTACIGLIRVKPISFLTMLLRRSLNSVAVLLIYFTVFWKSCCSLFKGEDRKCSWCIHPGRVVVWYSLTTNVKPFGFPPIRTAVVIKRRCSHFGEDPYTLKKSIRILRNFIYDKSRYMSALL